MLRITAKRLIACATLALDFNSGSVLAQEALPGPDWILVIQEREARERRVADRASMARLTESPAPAPSRPRRELTAREKAELAEACERFVRENPGVVPDLRKPVR